MTVMSAHGWNFDINMTDYLSREAAAKGCLRHGANAQESHTLNGS